MTNVNSPLQQNRNTQSFIPVLQTSDGENRIATELQRERERERGWGKRKRTRGEKGEQERGMVEWGMVQKAEWERERERERDKKEGNMAVRREREERVMAEGVEAGR